MVVCVAVREVSPTMAGQPVDYVTGSIIAANPPVDLVKAADDGLVQPTGIEAGSLLI